MTIQPAYLLRFALTADALASAAMGALLALAAGPLAGLLGLPEPLLHASGLVLLPYATLVGFVASRPSPSRPAAVAIVVLNALWVLDSVALVAGGWFGPTGLGIAFVLAQALAVGVLAIAQALGLRGTGHGSPVAA